MRLRYRMYLVVAASVLPVAGILFQNHVERADVRSRAVYDATMEQAKAVANALGQAVTGTRTLLSALSRAPTIRSGEPQRCRDYVRRVTTEFPDAVVIGAADLNGDVYCTSLPLQRPVNIARRAYFQRALVQDGFATGEALAGRFTGKRSISFSYPIRGEDRKPTGVLFFAMALEELARQLQLEIVDPSVSLIVADSQGSVLLDLPTAARQGETLAGGWAELLQPGTPVATQLDSPGGAQIVAAVPLRGDGTGLYVIAVRERAAAMEDAGAAAWRDALLLGLAFAWALLLTWLITRVSVERPVLDLLDAARAWSGGDYAARARIEDGSEFGMLASVFNSMADSIRTREQDAASTKAALTEAKDAAVRANRSKSGFLAAVSHDLRQPLTTLELSVAHVERMADTEPLRQALARTRRALAATHELLDSLTDFALVESGRLRANPAIAVADTLLDALREEFAPLADSLGLRFEVERCDAEIMTDPRLLARILRNLVSNALKFTPRGGHVSVRCERREGTLEVMVEDAGIGIAPDRQEQVFEEFLQIEPRPDEPRKGVGLGLAIVKRLCDLLQHPVRLSSAPGLGSVFTVSVPLAEATG